MTDREGVPTEDGRFVLQGDVLRVRTTVRGVLRGIYVDEWRGEDGLRRGWFLFSAVFGAVTLAGFVNDWIGLSDRRPSVGFLLSVLLVYAVFLALKLTVGRLRDGVSIPLRDVREVERGSDRKELRIVHGEFEDVEGTTIGFPSESDADAAVELLRWKGIRIAEVGERKANLRGEVERARERKAEAN